MPPVQDVAAFLAMRDQGLPLLDVRSPGEFALAHIPGALNLPLFLLGRMLSDFGVDLLGGGEEP